MIRSLLDAMHPTNRGQTSIRGSVAWGMGLAFAFSLSCSEPADDFQCPEQCPVITICKLCEDDSCASAVVSCNPDGSCGDVDWVCPSGEPPPGANACDQACPVPDICMICDDGSCANANVQCNADGSCGDIDWVCPDGEPPNDSSSGR